MSRKAKRATVLIASMLLLSMLCRAAGSKTIYVDDDAAGLNDGSSWMDAYVYLQDALADANSSEKPVEIRVAQGTYTPDEGTGITRGDREATFQVINGITLKGGYAGLTEPDPNIRKIRLYETILKGDLLGDDVEVPGANSLLDDITRQENSYHVVTALNVGSSAVLDGLSVTGGNSNGENEEQILGGGLYCLKSHLEIVNCVFQGNASIYGGAIFNDNSGALTVKNCHFIRNNAAILGGAIDNTAKYSTLIMDGCTFTENHAVSSGGAIMTGSSDPKLTNCIFERNSSARGGGIYNYLAGNPTLVDCMFVDNSVEHFGGGMYNNSGESGQFLIRCTFEGNFAGWYGGGFYNSYNGKPLIKHCIFIGNSSSHWGGAIHFWRSVGEVRNCTMVNNSAQRGGALGCGFENELVPSQVKITNCILWGNGEEIYNDDNSQIITTYSCIKDLIAGRVGLPAGLINKDPCFADPANGDYHLKSQAGRWDLKSESWVIDDVTSPCIDAGDPDSDWSEETWPHGGRINMGAYGGTREASMSTRPEPMSLPHVAYIYDHDIDTARSFRTLLVGYGCPTTLVVLEQTPAAVLDGYGLLIVGDDTENAAAWNDPQVATAIEGSGRPIVGMGEGGYYFFGELGLSIGWPHGMHGDGDSVIPIDMNHPLFVQPYSIDIPEDRILRLYTNSQNVTLYLPNVPDTVLPLAWDALYSGYYPLALEHYKYLFWGFTESPLKMTEVGRTLFINVVIRTANNAW